jgi:hypothetical protein
MPPSKFERLFLTSSMLIDISRVKPRSLFAQASSKNFGPSTEGEKKMDGQ